MFILYKYINIQYLEDILKRKKHTIGIVINLLTIYKQLTRKSIMSLYCINIIEIQNKYLLTILIKL